MGEKNTILEINTNGPISELTLILEFFLYSILRRRFDSQNTNYFIIISQRRKKLKKQTHS